MTLEEAILHLIETLNNPEHEWSCEECRSEHEQLAEWLEELKSRREADNPTKGWIKITSPASNETLIKCPYCEEEFIGKDVEDYKLCPICGKKMREEEQK